MLKRNLRHIMCLIPPHYDFLCAAIIDGLLQLDVTLYSNEKSNNCSDNEYIPSKYLADTCIKCDVILLFSNTGYQDRKGIVLENNMAKKTIYIDGSDWAQLEDPNALKTFPLCFKRELYQLQTLKQSTTNTGFSRGTQRWINQYHIRNKHILPLPFAAERAFFKHMRDGFKKDISVSCTLTTTTHSKERENINSLVRDLDFPDSIVGSVSPGNYVTASNDQKKDDYYKILARSKISISYPGAGYDTGRFWEILSNKALLFSPPLQLVMPHPFIEYKHFIPYSSLKQLEERLTYYVSEDKKRKEIAGQGFQHLQRYHTSKIRAANLLETASKILK